MVKLGSARAGRRRRSAVAMAVVLLLGAALAACREPADAPASPLAEDPMASWLTDDLELVSERVGEAEDADRTVTGKPVYATLTRVLRIVDGSAEDALAAGVEAADAAGWAARFERAGGFTGEKTIDGHLGVLTLALTTVDGEERLFLKITRQ